VCAVAKMKENNATAEILKVDYLAYFGFGEFKSAEILDRLAMAGLDFTKIVNFNCPSCQIEIAKTVKNLNSNRKFQFA
jgi:hypothetical protein